MAEEKEIGVITHVYGNINVAVIKITSGTLRRGDMIRIVGAHTDVTQQADSMEIDHEAAEEILEGQEAGMKVGDKVRVGDKVFLIS